MNLGRLILYHGEGKGKSAAALGLGLRAAADGKRVIFISFMKGSKVSDKELYKRLEPELKIFSISKSDKPYDELSLYEKEDEVLSIQNGLNFAKKILQTGECDILILDELLGLLYEKRCSMDDIRTVLNSVSYDIDIVITGNYVNEDMLELASNSYVINVD